MIKDNKKTMNIMLKLAIFLSLSLSLNVNASSDFDAAWTAADELRQQTAEIRNEWRDTEKILMQAKAEQAAGNKESAISLVAKAHEQAADAIAQAEREKSAWQSRVIK
ncbi:MAG: hypothetical protein ACI8XV_000682 [Arenicella sp.]|jgi:hypothetical protein